MNYKRLIFMVIFVTMFASTGFAGQGQAVYSIAGDVNNPAATYLNSDPCSTSGEAVLDISVASLIVTGDVDSDPFYETIYAIPGSGVYVNLSNTVGDVFQIQPMDVKSLAVGDVDGDGKDEIIYCIDNGGVYLQDGVAVSPIQIQPYDANIIVTGDTDGDGDDEIVYDLYINTGDPNDPNEDTHAGIYTSEGTVGSDRQLQGADYVPLAIAIGDVNTNDPGEEVVYGLNYQGSGNGTYMNYGPTGSDWQFQPYTADSIAIGDVDGDGQNEIVYDLLHTFGFHVGTYINEGTHGSDHQFQPWTASMITIGDYEEDGDAEIIYNLSDYSGVPQGVFVNKGVFGSDQQIRTMSADAIAFLPYGLDWDCDDPPEGDLNGDCLVDFIDFSLLAGSWLDCGRDPNSYCP